MLTDCRLVARQHGVPRSPSGSLSFIECLAVAQASASCLFGWNAERGALLASTRAVARNKRRFPVFTISDVG
jgi:hypothetical protein